MATQLLPDECRVLGVLVEKAQTTPAQYPLTLNGVITACSQKNNRDPVRDYAEEAVVYALDGLRAKGLARELSMEGSRVPKYRHIAREALQVDTSQLVVLAELLLRGPQTVGELRTHASRMHPLESTEVVQSVLQAMADRPEPLVREVPPSPGSRAPRWAQLLCPQLHPLDRPSGAADSAAVATAAPSASMMGPLSELAARVDRLEAQVAAMRSVLRNLGAELPEA